MAKRKRLTPANPMQSPVSETVFPAQTGARRATAPIADMAGAASATAALEDLAQELQDARAQGRMVISVPLDQIDESHLVRDRTGLDEAEMQELTDSLAARGQQTAIEVVSTSAGRYGLISGWRRLTAMRQLYAQTGDTAYAQIKCILRSPETASEAYLTMVEENEIRAPLSFYERAHVAARAAEHGAFEDPRAAVKALFASVSPSKRSKIHSFGVLYAHLDPVLRFARDIPEHLGLALAKALETEEGFSRQLLQTLKKADVQTAAQERAVIEAQLKQSRPTDAPRSATTAPRGDALGGEVYLKAGKGTLVLSGAGVDDQLAADLRAWMARRQGG